MGNLTVRVDDDLKREAERVAKRLDVTISQVVRIALNRLVVHGHTRTSGDPYYVGSVPEALQSVGRAVDSELRHVEIESVQRDIELNESKKAVIKARISELERDEKRNKLNPVTRKELKELRAQIKDLNIKGCVR